MLVTSFTNSFAILTPHYFFKYKKALAPKRDQDLAIPP
jgi:hypothetical protein